MKAPAKIRSPLAVVILLLTFLVGAAFPVQAKVINWKIAGPEGGLVHCLASPDATGTLIFAGCYGGVYRSTDAGERWQSLPKSPPMVSRLAINPLNPNILYAGWPNGVSKSSDGGRTWQLTLNSGYTSTNAIPEHSGRPPPVWPSTLSIRRMFTPPLTTPWGRQTTRSTAPFAAAATAARPGLKPSRPPLRNGEELPKNCTPFPAWPLIPSNLTSSMRASQATSIAARIAAKPSGSYPPLTTPANSRVAITSMPNPTPRACYIVMVTWRQQVQRLG